MRLLLFVPLLLSLLNLINAASVLGNITFPYGATSIDLVHTNIELIQVSHPEEKSLRRQTFIKKDGTFEFTQIPEGSYLLSVSSIKYNLQPFKLRVDVDAQDEVSVRVVQGAHPFEQATVPVPHPIQYIVNPKASERVYMKKRVTGILESGLIATIINNPLYLAGFLIAMGIVVAPYLLEKFDPEIAKLVKEQKAEKSGKNTKASIETVASLQDSAKSLTEKDLKAEERKIEQEEKKKEVKETKAELVETKSTAGAEKNETSSKKRTTNTKGKKSKSKKN